MFTEFSWKLNVSYGTYFFLKGVFLFMYLPHSPIFVVLCGKTGSGKTELLHHLELSGYPIIDLERIASHRGSAFGGLLLNAQPSQPGFDNEIKESFLKHSHAACIFIEQKPASLGKRKIPAWLYKKIEHGILVMLNADKKTRINNILREYGAAGKESFINTLQKLKERLSAAVMNECEALLHAENYEGFIESMLNYYDQTSKYNLGNFDVQIETEGNCPSEMMNILLNKLAEAGISIL